MPQTIYTASASEAKVNEETIEGLQSIEYHQVRNRHDVGAVGTHERIAVYFGLTLVSGRIRVASANPTLDRLLAEGTEFTISVQLKHGDNNRNVSFDGCFLDDKSFGLDTEHHGETIYTFTATRVREE
jgi:hypothetical protein